MKGKIVITLKSDLCVASGYSYAGIVDSDVCYDEYGLPYIPARRLKGCFRDTAKNMLYGLVGQDEIDCIFGVGGRRNNGSLRISNAYLKNYDVLRKEIVFLKNTEGMADAFSQQRVLEQFSRIVAQTAIDGEGAAEDSALRYTRVINHYIKTDDGYDEMVLEAVVEYDDILDEKIRLIVGATKSIGLKRNRGMGVIQCEISLSENVYNRMTEKVTDIVFNAEDKYLITYLLRNEEPLMLSLLSDMHSEKHVSGQTILGNLAGRYLSLEGTNSDTEEFRDLFLNGETRYIPAYPAEIDKDKPVCIFYPAPFNINCLKKTKDYVDTFFDVESGVGNQPRKIKGTYLFYHEDEAAERNIAVKETEMNIYYHHRKDRIKSDGKKEDGILYSLEAVAPHQIFAGQIYTSGKYVQRFIELLDEEDLYLGKSKGSQYGHCLCEVSSIDNVAYMDESDLIQNVVITLLSDAVFVADGSYTVDKNDILQQLLKKLPGAEIISEDSKATVMMETGLMSGYQTSWNMHKPLYPLVKAGSCFVLDVTNCKQLPKNIWVGTKNQEGWGYARVSVLRKTPINKKSITACISDDVSVVEFRPQYISILKQLILEKISCNAGRSNAFNMKGISKTQISRVLLMLKQCDSFPDFKKRIESIKTDNVRNMFIEKLINPLEVNGEADITRIAIDDNLVKKYMSCLTREDLSDIWRDYLLYNLTICKYNAKEA